MKEKVAATEKSAQPARQEFSELASDVLRVLPNIHLILRALTSLHFPLPCRDSRVQFLFQLD